MKLRNLVGWLVGITTLFVVATMAHAQQSQLPPCQGNNISIWTNCVGSNTIPNGEKYVGEYRDGKSNGLGSLTWPDGDKYVGEFKDGKFNGQGISTWTNGNKYVGQYKDDKRNGWGVFSFADGRQYVGEWVDGNNNGLGVFYDAQGQKVRAGRFQDNNLVQPISLDPIRFAYVSQFSALPGDNPIKRLSPEKQEEAGTCYVVSTHLNKIAPQYRDEALPSSFFWLSHLSASFSGVNPEKLTDKDLKTIYKYVEPKILPRVMEFNAKQLLDAFANCKNASSQFIKKD